MIRINQILCPKCNGKLKYYDRVGRFVIEEFRYARKIQIRRLRCVSCGSVHRELPEDVFPYKQYGKEIIMDILSGSIDYDTIGFEDYPCDVTILRWRKSLTSI